MIDIVLAGVSPEFIKSVRNDLAKFLEKTESLSQWKRVWPPRLQIFFPSDLNSKIESNKKLKQSAFKNFLELGLICTDDVNLPWKNMETNLNITPNNFT